MSWVDPFALDLLPRVLVAFALGGIVGLERTWSYKAAGLRTHMLVAGGAALFTIASFAIFEGEGTARDPARIAAQIVTGIGFLGAGAIFRSGSTVVGLTTAASIWMSAALGMLAGGGAYALAGVAALLTLLVLRFPASRLGPLGPPRRHARRPLRAARRGPRRSGADRRRRRSG